MGDLVLLSPHLNLTQFEAKAQAAAGIRCSKWREQCEASFNCEQRVSLKTCKQRTSPLRRSVFEARLLVRCDVHQAQVACCAESLV